MQPFSHNRSLTT